MRKFAEPQGFPLSLQVVQNLKDGKITSYEVRSGKIVVTMFDKYGDGHVHILDHSGVSKEEALQILSQKQAELAKQ